MVIPKIQDVTWVSSLFFWQWQSSSLAVGTSSASGNSIPGSGNALCILFPTDEADLTDFYAEIKNSLERDEGAVVSGHAGKSEAVVMRSNIDPLDSLARSAFACDVEYDQTLEDYRQILM
nr:hypothetical protein [Tanacetum cinerariifolium]